MFIFILLNQLVIIYFKKNYLINPLYITIKNYKLINKKISYLKNTIIT